MLFGLRGPSTIRNEICSSFFRIYENRLKTFPIIIISTIYIASTQASSKWCIFFSIFKFYTKSYRGELICYDTYFLDIKTFEKYHHHYYHKVYTPFTLLAHKLLASGAFFFKSENLSCNQHCVCKLS